MSSNLISTQAYFVHQLEEFDSTIHLPLKTTTAGRDVDFKVTPITASLTSYMQNNYGASGTQDAQGIPWYSSTSSVIPEVSVQSTKISTPFRKVVQQMSYDIFDLQESERTGQPIDISQALAMKELYSLNLDKAVYVGDNLTFSGFFGLVNNPVVTPQDVALNAALTSTEWANKTPQEILIDFNEILASTWEASGLAFPPNKILIPPAQYSLLAGTQMSTATDTSVMSWIKMNSLTTQKLGPGILEIDELKFLTAGDTAYNADPTKDRMIAYTKDMQFLRFPLATMQGMEISTANSISFVRPYFYGFGQMEIIKPETISYRDGI